jgi:hypothetical protein
MSIVFFAACTDDDLTSTKPVDDMISEQATLKFSGTFTNGPYGTVMNTAQIFENTDQSLEVKLASFTTTNGPDLYVYLSKEAMPINFIELGKLKSTNGNQVYAIPGAPDFSQYTYISVHCKAYNHLFGSALLEEVEE